MIKELQPISFVPGLPHEDLMLLIPLIKFIQAYNSKTGEIMFMFKQQTDCSMELMKQLFNDFMINDDMNNLPMWSMRGKLRSQPLTDHLFRHLKSQS